MSVGLYSTTELIGVQRKLKTRPDGFWLRLFTRTVTSDKQEIQFDVVDSEDRRLAPFVAPNVQGRVMLEAGYTARTFKPAYVKPKHVIDPTKAIPRMAGEAIGGDMTLQQRYDAHLALALMSERESIERRWDWMAAQALQHGSVLVKGDDYPAVTVSFERHVNLTYTLTLNDRWGESSEDPLGDIATARKEAFVRGNAPITNLVFGINAWSSFLANQDVQDLLDNNTRGTQSDFNRSAAFSAGEPFEYVGSISGFNGGGRVDMWTYSNTYKDEDGTTGDYLDPDHVVGFGGAINGFRFFGAILDRRSLRAVPMFPKTWFQEDPSVEYCMTQSAPLMVPMEPNNTFLIKTRG